MVSLVVILVCEIWETRYQLDSVVFTVYIDPFLLHWFWFKCLTWGYGSSASMEPFVCYYWCLVVPSSLRLWSSSLPRQPFRCRKPSAHYCYLDCCLLLLFCLAKFITLSIYESNDLCFFVDNRLSQTIKGE